MRKLCMALATVCALGTTTPPLAAERAELDTGGLGMSFGVLTPIGLLVEGGIETYGNFGFFNADDEFSLRQHYAAIGYQFELGDGWHIVPKAGRAKWELTSEEGWLFNDDDVETDKQRGYEYFWELGFGKRINDVMSLGGSVRSGSYDFGDAGSVAFLMTFSF